MFKFPRYAIAIACFMLTIPQAQARELELNDPLRKVLVDLAHHHPNHADKPDDKFIITRAWASSNYGLMCFSVLTPYGLQQTDDGIDQYLYGFRKIKGVWHISTKDIGMFVEKKALHNPKACTLDGLENLSFMDDDLIKSSFEGYW